jgi:hypothetical protein
MSRNSCRSLMGIFSRSSMSTSRSQGSHRWSPESSVPSPGPGASYRPFFILADTIAAHMTVRVTSDQVEPRRNLGLGEFPGQPPSLPWPASTPHQVSHKLFNELVAPYSEPRQAFPLLTAVPLVASRHGHQVFLGHLYAPRCGAIRSLYWNFPHRGRRILPGQAGVDQARKSLH